MTLESGKMDVVVERCLGAGDKVWYNEHWVKWVGLGQLTLGGNNVVRIDARSHLFENIIRHILKVHFPRIGTPQFQAFLSGKWSLQYTFASCFVFKCLLQLFQYLWRIHIYIYIYIYIYNFEFLAQERYFHYNLI